jgi:hypothetical protein
MISKDILRQSVVVMATIATITVNVLANALPINGLGTGDISDMFEVYFVPAGYVFSVWGVIYLAIAAYTIYQALPVQRDNPVLRRIGWLYVLGSIANIAWIFLWHYLLFVPTLAAMLTLLGTLIAIYLMLRQPRRTPSASEKWLVRLPFSIYLGWITVATIANITAVLDYVQWNAWGIAPEIWTIIMLVAGSIIAALMALTRADVTYGLVLVWAFAGIAVKFAGLPVIAASAGITAGLVAVFAVVSALPRGPLPLSRFRAVD